MTGSSKERSRLSGGIGFEIGHEMVLLGLQTPTIAGKSGDFNSQSNS